MRNTECHLAKIEVLSFEVGALIVDVKDIKVEGMKPNEANYILPVPCDSCESDLTLEEESFKGAGRHYISCPDCGTEMPGTYIETKFDDCLRESRVKQEVINDLKMVNEMLANIARKLKSK